MFGGSRIITRLHDATLRPLSFLDHATTLLEILQDTACAHVKHANDGDSSDENKASDASKELIRNNMPYYVIMECDGGPDHNITFL